MKFDFTKFSHDWLIIGIIYLFLIFSYTGLNWSWFHGALIRPKSRKKWSTRPHSTVSKKLLLESKKLFKPMAWTKSNRAALKIYCNKLLENERPKSPILLLNIFKSVVCQKTNFTKKIFKKIHDMSAKENIFHRQNNTPIKNKIFFSIFFPWHSFPPIVF